MEDDFLIRDAEEMLEDFKEYTWLTVVVQRLIAEVRRLREERDNLRLLCERMGQDEVRAGLGRDDA